MLQVEIDKNSGFCFGVVYAIEMAEEHLDEFGSLYCLGDIVHNDEEVTRLKDKGLQIISHQELKELKDATVLIRAHGEPPETYQIALQNNIQLVDASCPVVLKLQHRVREGYEGDTQIVIYGKEGHAEVNGLVGQTNGQAIVIMGINDLDKIDYSKPIRLYSQTTKSMDSFYKIKAKIESRSADFKANDTICRQVSNREPQLKIFAAEHQVIIFVSGKKSSNGKVLYEVCKNVNLNSYFISNVDEIDKQWFNDKKQVGVCGATSTPMWLMQEVKKYIETIA